MTNHPLEFLIAVRIVGLPLFAWVIVGGILTWGCAATAAVTGAAPATVTFLLGTGCGGGLCVFIPLIGLALLGVYRQVSFEQEYANE